MNKYRCVVSAVFNYGRKPSTFALPANPTTDADRRRERHPDALVFYAREDVEAVARTLAAGEHRDPSRPAMTSGETAARRVDDTQDAELVRVAAYAGLRLGELLALRWRDVDFAGCALTIARAMSARVEGSTKSGRVGRVPLADQAAAALERVSTRERYTAADDLMFCNVYGRTMDNSALRRRYRRRRSQPAFGRCASTTCGIRSGHCSPPAESMSSRSRSRWDTARLPRRAAACTRGRRLSRRRCSRRRSRRACPKPPIGLLGESGCEGCGGSAVFQGAGEPRWGLPLELRERVGVEGAERTLRATDEAAIEEAREALDWWRSLHARPLSMVAANLRYHVLKAGAEVEGRVEVTQRLKRQDTLIGKLDRERGNVTQMQDIGGVRAVVPSVPHAYRVRRRLLKS